MTNEEAICVLQSRIKLPDYGGSYGSVCEADYQQEAIDTAIAALRAQQEREHYGDDADGRLDAICEQCQIGYSDRLFLRDLLDAWEAECERENPKPLTLDELRELGETDWVWLTFPELPPEESGWYRAKRVYMIYSHEHYGKTWLAYRYKPKEE